jgi:hypothetical protein
MQLCGTKRAAEATHLLFAELEEFGDTLFNVCAGCTRTFENGEEDCHADEVGFAHAAGLAHSGTLLKQSRAAIHRVYASRGLHTKRVTVFSVVHAEQVARRRS